MSFLFVPFFVHLKRWVQAYIGAICGVFQIIIYLKEIKKVLDRDGSMNMRNLNTVPNYKLEALYMIPGTK